MWLYETEESRKAREDAQKAEFLRADEECRKKAEAREAIIKAACPRCGRHDPIPPWLI